MQKALVVVMLGVVMSACGGQQSSPGPYTYNYDNRDPNAAGCAANPVNVDSANISSADGKLQAEVYLQAQPKCGTEWLMLAWYGDAKTIVTPVHLVLISGETRATALDNFTYSYNNSQVNGSPRIFTDMLDYRKGCVKAEAWIGPPDAHGPKWTSSTCYKD